MPVFHDFPASNSAKRPARPGKPENRPPQPRFGLCRATIRTFPDTPRPKTGCTPRSPTHHGPKPDVPLGARHTTARNRMCPSEPDTPRPETAQVSAPTHWPQHPIPPTLYVLQSLMPVFHDFPASNSAKHAFRFSQHLSPSGSPEAQPGARHSPVPGPDPTDPTDPRFGLCRATIRTFPDTPRPKTGCALGSRHTTAQNRMYPSEPDTPRPETAQVSAPTHWPQHPIPPTLYVLQSLMPVFHDFPASNSAKRGEVAPRARGGSNTQSETPGTVHDELVPGATRSQNAFQITPRLRRAPPQEHPQGAFLAPPQSIPRALIFRAPRASKSALPASAGDHQLQAQPSLAYQPQRSRWSAPCAPPRWRSRRRCA
ncbi:Uncharacterised protein [Corynebacterium urealyticum]|nr:Uncharacterised protein [Corynebacterium urealyticum]